MYDPEALAVTGLLYLASRSGDAGDLRQLLHTLPQHCDSAAKAFVSHQKAVATLGVRAVQAAVRIGIDACVFARRTHLDEDPREYEAREDAVQTRRSQRLAAEEGYLFENSLTAPSWLSPPPRRTRPPSRRIRVPGGVPEPALPHNEPEWRDFYFDDRTAAEWTQCLTALGRDASDAVKALIVANKEWLIDANGTHEDVEDEDIERTWTGELMRRAAEHAKAWSVTDRRELIFDIMSKFSDEAFIDAASVFLLQSDLLHIEGATNDTAYLVELRQTIWARLKETRHWQWHLSSTSSGMEIHLKQLVSTLFLKVDNVFGGGRSYTGGLCKDQLVPFFPILTEIASDTRSSPVIALLFLDALETVEAHVAVPFVLEAAAAWAADGDSSFWNGFGFGRRVCALLESAQIGPEEVTRLSTIADAVSAAGVIEGENLRATVRKLGG